MVTKILIINRGECAARLLRTALQMIGICVAVVYTKDDKDYPYIQEAGEAIQISDYNSVVDIMTAATQCGADAILPGWGFLSENPKLARACQKAGITFIGPPEDAMKICASKEKTKASAKKVGIPVIPGTPETMSNGELQQWLKDNGLVDGVPFMLKATAGGGGSGNKLVSSLEEFDATLAHVESFSEKLFGSPNLLAERYITNARHIEVQFACDKEGHFLYLGTRDCSLQLNYQKVIEIAPAWVLTKEQEEDLCRYAEAIAKQVGYWGVGTVEFLLTENGEIFFLEINPRLQVEHGVTELITGLDLVEMQIRIAQGEDLSGFQGKVCSGGFAMEARINTLKCDPGYPERLIATDGKVKTLHFPKGKHVRTDHALFVGQEINPLYNPTQAKVMVWAQTYPEAIGLLTDNLQEIEIEEVETNIPLLIKILRDPKVAQGEFNVEFLHEFLKRLAKDERQEKERAAAGAVGVALALQSQNNHEKVVSHDSLWRYTGRWEQMRVHQTFRDRRR